MLNVEDASSCCLPKSWSCFGGHFRSLKREGLKTTALEVKHIWSLEEVGVSFPLWSSV